MSTAATTTALRPPARRRTAPATYATDGANALQLAPTPAPATPAPPRPVLRLVEAVPAETAFPLRRPRLLDGAAERGRAELRFQRRRLGALAVAALLTVLLAAGAAVALRAVAAPSAGGPRPAVATVVAEPGDSLWSIARRLQPEGDVRPLVDELVALNGGAGLFAGDVVRLPVATGEAAGSQTRP